MSSSKASFSSFSSSILLLLLALCILAFPLPSAHGAPSATPASASGTVTAPAATPSGSVLGPAANLTATTVCASSDGGSWIVGLNGRTVTLAKVLQGSTTLPQTFVPAGMQAADKYFKTGRCFEGNTTTVYYISDSLTGGFLINGTTATWEYLGPQPSTSFPVENLNASTSTVGLGQTGSTDSVAVGVFNGVIDRWDLLSSTASTVGSLAGITTMSGDTSIIGLALSSAGGPASLWVYYTAINNTQQLVQINLDNPTDHTLMPILFGLTTLVPLTTNDGVALLGPSMGSTSGGNTVVQYFWTNKPSVSKTFNAQLNAQDQFVVSDTSILQVNPSQLVATAIELPNGEQGTASTALPLPSNPASPHKKSSPLGIILGVAGGVVALMAIAATLILWRRRSRKPKDLFPAKRDDTLIPLGLYHQDRGLPEIPRHLDNDLERLGYAAPRNQDGYGNTLSNQQINQHQPYPSRASYLVNDSRNSVQSNLDSTIPLEAAMRHNQHETHTPQGLTHSISVSSTTSNFARRNAKNGKRFEEKIQLQVIRYETQDAHLISPHGPTGRLVLGTYHVVSLPRSARSIKKQGGASPGVARSGTVVVRRSRVDMNTAAGSADAAAAAGESSMLLTECENQHTFEVATLKWYMTEIHWKREAALLKHLKSPIFVMELLESYCIPSLQNRVHTYPFVNAMGGCSSLLSDLGPVQTAAHVRSILRSVSAAVEWCHRHGVVHLNIQPGSFFLEDGIDPMTEGASWKLWDFTCARFIGEPVGLVGGGGGYETGHQHHGSGASSGTTSPSHLGVGSDSFAFMEQRQHEEKMDRIGGNPLPAAYTAPELLEAWRAGDTTYPAEACMDAWSLGCVYYEILTGGQPLFQTEAEAWNLVGGWSNQSGWASQNFRVPYPPSPPVPAQYSYGGQGSTPEYERSQILDPSGSIARLLQDMMTVHADERVTLETIMERIY